jgi:hypothetical protein
MACLPRGEPKHHRWRVPSLPVRANSSRAANVTWLVAPKDFCFSIIATASMLAR